MAEKSKLAEILGLEEDEEYTVKGYDGIFRIHNGKRERKSSDGTWYTCGFEKELIELINDPTLIQRKPHFNDEEMMFLRLLHKFGKVCVVGKSIGGSFCRTNNGKLMVVNISESLNLNETIDLDELFKEDEDG